MPKRFENEAAYDVLFVGEQTSLVMRLVAALVREGYRPAILNGPALVEKLHLECGVDADHFACPPVQLPGRYKAPVIRTLEWPMQRSRLRNAIRRINPAVIHVNYIKAEHSLLTEIGADCRPIVSTVWGTDLHHDAADGDRTQRRRIAKVLQHSEVITADSLELLDCARELAPQKTDVQFKLVLWGIDVDAFSSAAADESARQWRQRLEVPADAPVVLAPRRMDPRYNPERVLKTFAKTQAARNGFCVFKVFGDNPRIERRQQDMLSALAQKLGIADRVRFAPACAYGDLPGLYRMADVACMLLSHDGTPTTAFELMAARTPLVMSDVPDYEGMIVDGEHAWLAPPADSDAAATVVDRILAEPRDVQPQLERARTWVLKHATIDATVDNFLAAYRQACRASSPRSVTNLAE